MGTKQTSSTASKLMVVERIEDIPEFGSEAEEHAFWATHELGDALWDQAEPLASDELPDPRPKATPVLLRLDERTLARVQALARRQHKSYQALLKEFVLERLDEEEQQAAKTHQ